MNHKLIVLEESCSYLMTISSLMRQTCESSPREREMERAGGESHADERARRLGRRDKQVQGER